MTAERIAELRVNGLDKLTSDELDELLNYAEIMNILNEQTR